jgi:hypothetical protein
MCTYFFQVLFGGDDTLKPPTAGFQLGAELSNVLCELAKSNELFLITQTDSDTVERLVTDALEASGVFDAGMNRLVSSKQNSIRIFSRAIVPSLTLYCAACSVLLHHIWPGLNCEAT